jgi:hypothetical protein
VGVVRVVVVMRSSRSGGTGEAAMVGRSHVVGGFEKTDFCHMA